MIEPIFARKSLSPSQLARPVNSCYARLHCSDLVRAAVQTSRKHRLLTESRHAPHSLETPARYLFRLEGKYEVFFCFPDVESKKTTRQSLRSPREQLNADREVCGSARDLAEL